MASVAHRRIGATIRQDRRGRIEVRVTAGLEPIPAGTVAVAGQLVEVVDTDREIEAVIDRAFHQELPTLGVVVLTDIAARAAGPHRHADVVDVIEGAVAVLLVVVVRLAERASETHRQVIQPADLAIGSPRHGGESGIHRQIGKVVLVGRGHERARRSVRGAGVPVPLGIQPSPRPQVGGRRVRVAPVVLHGAPQGAIRAVQVRRPRPAVAVAG